MNLLFPDRVRFSRDPLGFLLSRAESTSAPLVRLRLGLPRLHLVNDSELLKCESFRSGPLCFSGNSSDVILSNYLKNLNENNNNHRTAINIQTLSLNSVIQNMIDGYFIELRRSFFAAHRHASVDCWRFSSLLATKLTFIAIFGIEPLDIIDIAAFARSSDELQRHEESIIISTIYGDLHAVSNIKKSKLYTENLKVIQLYINTVFKLVQSDCIYRYVYMTTGAPHNYVKELYQLVLCAQQSLARAIFWSIFSLAHSQNIRSAIEDEADACQLSNGDINIQKIRSCKSTISISQELIRLDPLYNIFLFRYASAASKQINSIKAGDNIIICPHTFFRSPRFFRDENSIMVGRQYDRSMSNLHHLASGGGVVFHLALLNSCFSN